VTLDDIVEMPSKAFHACRYLDTRALIGSSTLTRSGSRGATAVFEIIGEARLFVSAQSWIQ